VFGTPWRIARVAGIDIKVDTSWLLIALFIGYTFFARFDLLYDELTGGEAVALAAAAAVVFFGSVLVHELAHSVFARARGIPVKGITLFLFGGATEITTESRSPKDEFVIAVVGPLTSFAIGGVLWVLAAALGASDEAIPGTIGYLAWVNVSLGVFNMLPGLPLDGGRVLRSAVWAATGDMDRASRVAARAGQVLGYGIMALGL